MNGANRHSQGKLLVDEFYKNRINKANKRGRDGGGGMRSPSCKSSDVQAVGHRHQGPLTSPKGEKRH